MFYEASAKTGDNVELAINALTSKIKEKRLEQVRQRKEERRRKKEERAKGGKNSQLDMSIDSQASEDERNNKGNVKLANQEQKTKGFKREDCKC